MPIHDMVLLPTSISYLRMQAKIPRIPGLPSVIFRLNEAPCNEIRHENYGGAPAGKAAVMPSL
jgi:hypothetical protein